MSKEDKKYNGYTNYETWCIKLWIDHDQDRQEYWAEKVQEAWEDSDTMNILSHKERAAQELSEVVKAEFEENNPLANKANVYSDLINAGLSEVNWYEIALSLIDNFVSENGIDSQEKKTMER